MKLGLHLPSFTFPGGPPRLAGDLAAIAAAAERAGFDRVSVMDHFWQIGAVGPRELEMLEAYTTLGFLAAHTSRVRLLALVTAAVYRHPGVLSGGRAMLGIGAAWNEEEATGLGVPFPPLPERFERLEEAIQICLQMWGDDVGPYSGRHYRLGETLNSPGPLSRPHPPILIGGGGEQRTLRLVARYADACNLFANADLAHKLDVLRAHCEAEGRDFDAIEKTVLYNFDVGEDAKNASQIVDELGRLAELGFSVAHGRVKDVSRLTPLEQLGEHVVPAVARL